MEHEFLTLAQIGEWVVHPVVMNGMVFFGLLVALFSHEEVVSAEPARSFGEFFAFNLQFILAAAIVWVSNLGLHWGIGITQFEFLRALLQVLLPFNHLYLSINCGLVAFSLVKVLLAYGERVLEKKTG